MRPDPTDEEMAADVLLRVSHEMMMDSSGMDCGMSHDMWRATLSHYEISRLQETRVWLLSQTDEDRDLAICGCLADQDEHWFVHDDGAIPPGRSVRIPARVHEILDALFQGPETGFWWPDEHMLDTTG